MSVSDETLTILAKNQTVLERVQEKIDFIIGREIEVGGIYKGIVSSIKEYGAFVEFNGGQQGLLHVSELSHEPVSKISDVISVGQQLSLMCIGQDVRGNIKLSLKATLPQLKSKKNNVTEEPVPVIKEAPKVWTSVGNLPNEQEEQKLTDAELMLSRSTVKPSTSSNPGFLIRSAAECDEEDKTVSLNQGSKSNSKTLRATKRDCKRKTKVPESDDSDASIYSSGHSSHTVDRLNDEDAKVVSPLSAKSLKLGMKIAAKVYQIRALGLVLDLGNGVRGMYRFETNGKRDFEIGDELLVKCTSFSSKGLPVMSLVDDE